MHNGLISSDSMVGPSPGGSQQFSDPGWGKMATVCRLPPYWMLEGGISKSPVCVIERIAAEQGLRRQDKLSD